MVDVDDGIGGKYSVNVIQGGYEECIKIIIGKFANYNFLFYLCRMFNF